MSVQDLSAKFIEQIEELMGKGEAKALCLALDKKAPTSIRFNQKKAKPTITSRLNLGASVPWCTNANYLNERPLFTADPLFHLGYYYVQEASSMLLQQVKQFLGDKPIKALDLCAAPGGKSTLLQDILPEGSLLVSNEVVPNRASILLENMLKCGNPMSIVTSSMPDKWAKVKDTFDFILVDAPCSGEGMFRKEMRARQEWQADSPILCAMRQKDILSNIYGSLRANGLLVYSTCTFNRLENEDIVNFIMEEFDVEALDFEDLPEGVLLSPYSSYPCYRMQPNRLQGEGLFMAVFRKKGDTETKTFSNPKKQSKNKKQISIPQEVKSFLRNAKAYEWELQGDNTIYAYKALLSDCLKVLKVKKIAVLSAGIPVAEVKGKSLIPHSALALSTELNEEAFESVELNQEDCIRYLGRQNIQLEGNLSKGFKLITYQGLGLGFVKHLGNRANNLYPNEWRIRQWETIASSIK